MALGRPREFDEDEALQRAMDVFWEAGFEGAGITALTQAMGIGRQSLYDTFGDKHALYLRAVDAYVRDRMGPVLELLEHPDAGRAALETVLDIWVSRQAAEETRGCFLAGAASNVPLDDETVSNLIRGHVEHLESAFKRVIANGVRSGELKPLGNPRQVARALTAFALGLGTLGRLGVSIAHRRDIAASARTLLGLD